MMGASFLLVRINEKLMPRIVENVRRYGLRERLAAVNRMQVERLTDLGVAFDDAEARPGRGAVRSRGACQRRGRRGSGDRGGRGGDGLAGACRLHTAVGMPILNGITNLAKLGEMAVKTDRLMGGRFTSKRCSYAPPADQIAEFRRHYGADIYPTVQAP